jgi:hypothetical protein
MYVWAGLGTARGRPDRADLPASPAGAGSSISPNSVRNITETTRVTTPRAETPTSATPPDTLATPLVISLACCDNVSSEPLSLLRKLPRSLCLASSTIRGSSSLNSRTAPTTACATTSATAPRAITIVSRSTAADSLRLHRSRRSIALTTGERTATLKKETKITRRTFAIDASAHAVDGSSPSEGLKSLQIGMLCCPRRHDSVEEYGGGHARAGLQALSARRSSCATTQGTLREHGVEVAG